MVSSAEDLSEVPEIQVQAPFGDDEVTSPGRPSTSTAFATGYQEAHTTPALSLKHLEAFQRERAKKNSKKIKGRQLHVPLSWNGRSLSKRLFGVLRHAERADILGSHVNGESWSMLEESKQFPIDPPLSDNGRQEAVRVGTMVKAFADRSGGELHVVVSSLYLRCVETAIEVCKRLGPATKLILDHSLGEVFGYCVLGDQKPVSTWRSPSYLVRYARSHGVQIVKKVCGKVPAWPETLRMARMRYASAFLGYLRRAELSKRNFVLVSHADCIASVLALIPSKAGRMVESVSPAASVLGSLTDHRNKHSNTDEGASDESDPPARSTRAAWAVELDRIVMGPRWRNGDVASRAAKRAIQNGSEGLNFRVFEELLGGLSQEPLGDRSPKSTRNPEVFEETSQTSTLSPTEARTIPDTASCCSSSTILFGTSETGSEYDISPKTPSSSRTEGEVNDPALIPRSASASDAAMLVGGTDAVRTRPRFLTTGHLSPGKAVGSSSRSSSAGAVGPVKLQGCNGSAIMARRKNMTAP